MNNSLMFIREVVEALREARRINENTAEVFQTRDLEMREHERKMILTILQDKWDADRRAIDLLYEYEKPEMARITEESYD